MIKKNLKFIFLLCSILVVISYFGISYINKPKDNNNISEFDILWDSTVGDYLECNLWESSEIYDAGHFLMVPLHYASQSTNKKYLEDFENHFTRFISEGLKELDISKDENRLDTLHYYYLISRYIALNEKNGVNDKQIDYLATFLLEEINKLWNELPAWQWDHESYKGGIRERVLWKLNNEEVNLSYYRAIIDEELFTFAIAADLKTYFPNNPLLLDITDIAYQVFKKEGEFDTEGRWLFQTGVWSDHPDYEYSGYTQKDKIQAKLPLDNIATDSSHFHRFPLWIKSLLESFPANSKESDLFFSIKEGLEKQFLDYVVVFPTNDFPYVRLHNYMDGYNGVYRWSYPTQAGNGFGPYELTGTFTIGWWAFLGNDKINDLYADLSDSFPLPNKVVELYVGPNTSRIRNDLITDPNFYYNGYGKIISLMASKLTDN